MENTDYLVTVLDPDGTFTLRRPAREVILRFCFFYGRSTYEYTDIDDDSGTATAEYRA